MDIFNDDITLIEWIFIQVDGEYRVVGLIGGDYEFPAFIVSSPVVKIPEDKVIHTDDQNVYILNKDYPPCSSDRYRNNFENTMFYVLRAPKQNGFGREIDYKVVSLDEIKSTLGATI